MASKHALAVFRAPATQELFGAIGKLTHDVFGRPDIGHTIDRFPSIERHSLDVPGRLSIGWPRMHPRHSPAVLHIPYWLRLVALRGFHRGAQDTMWCIRPIRPEGLRQHGIIRG